MGKQIWLALPLKYTPNATTSYCLHCNLFAPDTETSHLDYYPIWSFCPYLCPLRSFFHRESRVVILKHKSNKFTALTKSTQLLIISSQSESETLTIAYQALYHLALLPLWPHFPFLFPASTPLQPQCNNCAPTWHLCLEVSPA